MNNTSYGTNVAHPDHAAVQNNIHSGHSGHPAHQTSMTPAISTYFNPHNPPVSLPAHQQSAQLQLQTIRTNENRGTHVTNPSPVSAPVTSGLYDTHQVQLSSALEKTFFNTAVAGIQPSAQRFYSSVTPNVSTSVSTNPAQQVPQQHHSHQQGNTILITNNFAAHQYEATASHAPDASVQMQSRTAAGVVGGVPPEVTTATGGYNNSTASNIRIITTLPDTIHHHQQQQHIYNLTKDVEPTVRDDILQLPQFYHTPHQSSGYAQQLSTILPSHFTQHFAASSAAGAPIQITQDDAQQQHQYFMTMSNDNDGGTTSATTLATVPKVMPNITGEVTAVTGAVTTASTMVSSPAPTTTSNSTLVLDRINICINNHYSDSLASNNSLPATTLDSNAIAANSSLSSAVHTFSTATHAPQQPSPIIPAIHHKVVLEPVGSSGSTGTLLTDSYVSNDSTLVIDEPDSTTTTPHTPPTTPENSSPPPLPTSLTPRPIVTPQAMAAQILIEDTVINDKENYIIPQTVSLSSMKSLGNKVTDKTGNGTSAHAFTTITQSIDLIDDDESDYDNSEVENDKENARHTISNDAIDDSVMEIEDDDVELLTPETMRIKTHIQSVDLETPNIVSHQHSFAGLQVSCIGNDSKVSHAVSPKSPTTTKTIQIGEDKTASTTVTLLTPPTPTTSPPSTQGGQTIETTIASTLAPLPEISFSMGEDVFIRKDDGRQYLGTVIGSSAGGGINTIQQIQYLIRFDDNSELWCGTDQMRRLGSGSGSSSAQMCVACKRTQLQDIVEICDDCRRGYHRSCTRETLPGSGVWWCLRCSKPMKEPPNTEDKPTGRPLSNYKNSYKNFADISKSLPSSSKLKTPADVYEFHTDNEVFTSDDEIPIKHIIEKARKIRDSAQNSSTNNIRPKSIKKQNSTDGILCEKILDLDDENANDANSVNKTTQTPKKEKVRVQDSPSVISSKTSKSATSIEGNVSGSGHLLAATSTVEHNTAASAYINKAPSLAMERTSRKRKDFTLSNTYKEVAAEAASKRYDSSRICDSSSDENSSSSRGTSLDVIIPAPKNFLGLNNPFRMVTPKKSSLPSHTGGKSAGCVQSLFSFNRSGTMIKNSIFNTTALDFSSKLAALKSAGIFPNLSTSNLVKAAGQPRTVRTIKRRLSAKDITIGPNQEVRRRRTRRLSSNVEVISTTTINPIPTNFFPIHAKDLLSTHTQLNAPMSTSRFLSSFSKQQQQQQRRQSTSQQQTSTSISSLSSASSASASPPGSVVSSVDSQVEVVLPPIKPSHGRRLRQRPQKNSPANSRRSSISSASTASSTNSSSNMTLATLQQQQQALHTNNNKNTSNVSTDGTSMQDLKQSVKEYFGGAINRIESGEQFCIRAKRQLANGQMQYLIEWGDVSPISPQTQTTLPVITSPSSTTTTLADVN